MGGLPSPMLVGSPDQMHNYLAYLANGGSAISSPKFMSRKIVIVEDRRGEE
jgi:hypothetical protein